MNKIILNHLTLCSKLWNVANYNIINGSLKPKELKTKLKDTWYKNLHSQSSQAVLENYKLLGKIATKNILKDHAFNLKMDISL